MQGWMEGEGRIGLKEWESHGLCFLKSMSQRDWMRDNDLNGWSKGFMRGKKCGREM